MNWTMKKTQRLMEMLSSSSSVDEIDEFVGKVNGRMPSRHEIREAGYADPWHALFTACLEDQQSYQDKFTYIDSKGGWGDKSFALTYALLETEGNGKPINTQSQLEFTKEVLAFLLNNGWEFLTTPRTSLSLCYAYYDDIPFLRFLDACDIEDFDFAFSENSASDIFDLLAFLLSNSAYSTIDFLGAKGLLLADCYFGASKPCVIGRGCVPAWSKAHIDYLALKGVRFSFCDYSENCDFDTYCYAMERLGSRNFDASFATQEKLSSMWGTVIESGRFDIGDYLLASGISVPNGSVDLRSANMQSIDWALAVGLKLRIHVGNDRDLLLYAAKHGLEPYGSVYVDKSTHKIERFKSFKSEEFEGMQAICETHDKELISAFLDAGYGDDIDASSAFDNGEGSLIDTYESHGINTVSNRVARGDSYVENHRVALPEGITEIAEGAFESIIIDSIKLPSSLEAIGARAFARSWLGKDEKGRSVVVPSGVRSIGRGAFFGWSRICVYDNLDKDALDADAKIDEVNGLPNGELGWIAAIPKDRYALCAANASMFNHEITVLSSKTDEVKYRVYMPVEGVERHVYCTLLSSWGKNSTFHFPVLEKLFPDLPDKKSKIKTAVNRLLWPISLDERGKEAYVKYLCGFAKDAVEVASESNDLDAAKMLVEIGAVKKTNVDALIEAAKKFKSTDVKGFLKRFKAEHFAD